MKKRNALHNLIITLPLAIVWLLLTLIAWPARAAWTIEPLAPGTIIAVNTTNDELNSDGDCSLREAVRAANLDSAVDGCPSGSGADTITIPAGTYSLSLPGDNEEAALTGDLDLTGEVAIEGVAAADTIIRSAVLDRVFHVLAGVQATFTNLTIRDGEETLLGGGGLKAEAGSQVQISSSWIISNTAPGGGGISNAGSMTITLSTIANNNGAPFSGGAMITNPTGVTALINSTIRDNQAMAGGALSTFNGHFILIASTLSNNQATGVTEGGGAIRAAGSSTIDLINSTLSGNSSAFGGGGIYAFNSAVINLHNATVANNNTAGSGGGLSVITPATVNMSNSILADNFGNTNPDCAATINSLGYNLVEIVSSGCVFSGNQTGVLTAVDPLLGPLQANGGPTQTKALLAGSPAINSGNPAGCTDPAGQPLITDQRGFPRPVGSVCDMGAYESEVIDESDFLIYLPLVIRS